MKNRLKVSFLILSIAVLTGACKGNNSSTPADSTRDTTALADTTKASTQNVDGANGAPDAVAGTDNSGAGGDTTKKSMQKETNR